MCNRCEKMRKQQSDKFDIVMDKMRGIIQNRESADVAEKMIELWDEDIANMKEKAIEESKQKQEYWKNQPHADESDDETESIQNAEQKPKKPIKKQSHRNKDTISHAASHSQTNGGHPYKESPYQPLRNNYYNQQRSYSDVVRTRYVPNRSSSYSRYSDVNNSNQKYQGEPRRHFSRPKFSHEQAPPHQYIQKRNRRDYDYTKPEIGYNHNRTRNSHHRSSARYNAPLPSRQQSGHWVSTNLRYTKRRRETMPRFRNEHQPSPQNHFLW